MSAMRVVFSLLVLTLAGCGESADEEIPLANYADDPPLGTEYVIGYGETLNLAEGVSLEFTTLAEDSRCPTGVQCVWEGNARILLSTFTPRGNGSVELNTNPQFAISRLFDYYGVELRKLEPYPVVSAQNGTATIPVSSYEATVYVIRHSSPP
jgi:hypothetical protein